MRPEANKRLYTSESVNKHPLIPTIHIIVNINIPIGLGNRIACISSPCGDNADRNNTLRNTHYWQMMKDRL